jgi:serine/threonine-protein kinase
MDASSDVNAQARARIGTVLRGKYRIDGVLGVGGMAVVYTATHRNQKRFAIKMLRAELSLHPELRQRFLREGYVANTVDHPGAVAVLDDDVAEDGSAFLVMELLRGASLDSLLEASPAGLPARAVVAIGDALLDTLAAAHAKAIVHRDLKPANLFLTREGQLKVLDFGIARLRDGGGGGSGAMTNTGVLLGTPAFMAPEQALGNSSSIDARTDLFAAGATLFTLLTGRLVHDAPNGAQMMIRAATSPAPSVGSVSTVAPPIAAVIDRALAFASGARWPGATEMREALRAAAIASMGAAPGPADLVPLLAGLPATSQPQPSSSGFERTELAPSTPQPAPEAALAPTQLPAPILREKVMTTGQGVSGEVVATKRSAPPPPRRSPWRTWAVSGAGVAAIAAAALFVKTRPRPEAAPKTTTAECETSATCAARGDRVCRAGACVSLASEDCRPLAEPGDAASDDTLWIGVLFPQAGAPGDAFGKADTNAADLARRDFAQVAHGVAARAGSRRLALVACDDAADPERAARHLVSDLHVPAVVGFYKSQEVIDLARSVFFPNHVLVVAANNRNPLVTTVPAPPGVPRLVYRVNASAKQLAAPASSLLSDVLTPALRKEHVLKATELPRVAVVRGSTPTSLAYGEAIAVDRLRVGGPSFEQSFRQFVVDDDAPNAPKVAADVIAWRPNVVVDEFDTLDSAAIFAELEARWPAGAPRPRYVVSDMMNESLARAVGEVPERRLRVLGADTPSSTPANVRYAFRYNEFYSPRVTASSSFGAAYDGLYLVAYAATAAEGPLDGPSLARAIPLLAGPGPSIEVGATGIFDATNALHSGQHPAIAGALGPLAFDESGDRLLDFAVLCFHVSGGLAEPVESGMIYRARAQRLEGEARCP